MHELAPSPAARRPNLTLWLVIALPLAGVVGGLTSVLLAYRSGDVPLPERYHWEGSQLGADQARLAAAARRGIGADFSFDARSGQCRVALRGAAPAVLRLDLAHATRSGLDRQLELRRAGSGDVYAGACAPLAAGHWWLELADPHDDWLVRQRIAR